jgi:uncharacterized membrane protein (DUF485 family)
MKIFDFKNELSDKESSFTLAIYWIIFLFALTVYFIVSLVFKFNPSWFRWAYYGVLFLNLTYFLIRFIPTLIIIKKKIKLLDKEIEQLNKELEDLKKK